MIEGNGRTERTGRAEEGIALLLAIMALMLLTFLGLTLATTTSTELQIATNYRWSQQALYNAEAGLEAGKAILRSIPVATPWSAILPTSRGTTGWTVANPGAAGMPALPSGMPGTDDWGNTVRNWESGSCDARGGQVGYGVVLNDTVSAGPQGLMQAKSIIFGQRLNGAVTLWVRRDYRIGLDGQLTDETNDAFLILTSEGVAPYTEADTAGAFARANQAVRVVEAVVARAQGGVDPCESYRSQTGGGVSGSNLGSCTNTRCQDRGDTLLDRSMGDSARDSGGSLSTGSGAAGTYDAKLDVGSASGCVE